MKEFFKSFLSFGLATSIGKVLGFVLLPIYTRVFNKVEYGVIDMVGTILSIAAVFGILQLETSLQRYYYEYTGLKKKLLISNIYIWIIISSVIMGVLLFILAPMISFKLFNTIKYAELIKIISFRLPFMNLSVLGLVLLRFEKENGKFLIVVIVDVFFALLFAYLFVVFFKWGLPGVFYAQLGSGLISCMLVTIFVRHLFVLKLSKRMTRRNFKYALPQFPARIGSVALDQANRFFMLGYLSLAAIGIYSVSLKLASSIQIVSAAFAMAWAPFMFVQFKNKNNKAVFSKVFPMVVGATFLCVCLISLFSQEMVELLSTHEFYLSHKYVGGLALYFSFFIINEAVDIGPRMTEKTKYLTLTFFLTVAVNLTSLFFSVKYLGIEGVIISMVITNLFLVIMSWYISNRLYYVPFSVSKFVLLLIPVLIIVFSTMLFDLKFLFRFIVALVCVIFYGLLLWHFYKRFTAIHSSSTKSFFSMRLIETK